MESIPQGYGLKSKRPVTANLSGKQGVEGPAYRSQSYQAKITVWWHVNEPEGVAQ